MVKILPPRSQRAWDNFRARIAELDSVVLEQEYLGSKTPHCCRCARGHECNPTPNNVARGQGICLTCRNQDNTENARRRKIAQDNFRRCVAERFGGEVLEREWFGVNKPHHCRCAKGHECWPHPANVLGGGGLCRVCASRDPATAQKNFYKRIIELRAEVLETEWLGALTPHLCRCVNGHLCRPIPGNVQQGRGICRTCAGTDPAVTRENFYKGVSGRNGLVLEQRWLGKDKPHKCLCAKGHECSPRPCDVRVGGGLCKICARNDPVTAQKLFYRLVAEQRGTVLEDKWLGARIPHLCQCVNGHKCRPVPDHVQRGGGICLTCAGKEWNVLYVVRNPVARCVKFGITSRDGRQRLYQHNAAGYTEIISVKVELPEGLARYIEQKIRDVLSVVGAKPVRGREYFSEDYLALILNEIDNRIF